MKKRHFSFSPGSSEDIANALQRLLEDKSLAAELGYRAQVLVENEYSLQTMALAYRNVISDQMKYDEG